MHGGAFTYAKALNMSDSYAGFNPLQDSRGFMLYDSMANRNDLTGFSGNFASSVRVLHTLLAKGNAYAQFDFENAFQSYNFEWSRGECIANSSGLIIAGNSSINATFPFIMDGCSGAGRALFLAGHSEIDTNMQGGTTNSQIELRNSYIGTALERESTCVACEDFTYSGNTINVKVDVGSLVYEFPGAFDLASKYRAEWDDDFGSGAANSTGNVGDLGWNFTGTGTNTQTGAAGRPGIWQLVSIATSNTNAYACFQACGTPFIDADDHFEFRVIFRIPTITNATVRFGLLSTNADDPTDGIYFERCDTVNGGCATSGETTWFTVVRSASAETRVNTSVTVSAGTWYNAMVRRNGTTIEFYNNNIKIACFNSGGTDGCTASSNITGALLQPILNIKPTSASARNFETDYVRLVDIGLAR